MSDEAKITAMDLLQVLAKADALETFCRLPKADQEKFSHWIGKARDNESHWRRITTLALAMKSGPLQPNRHRAGDVDEIVRDEIA